jgi:hypothetical protein
MGVGRVLGLSRSVRVDRHGIDIVEEAGSERPHREVLVEGGAARVSVCVRSAAWRIAAAVAATSWT